MVESKSSDAVVKELLDKCHMCNTGLVEAVKERESNGESVNAICKDLEDYQRQVHGEVIYSASALRSRYQYATGLKPAKPAQSAQVTPDQEALDAQRDSQGPANDGAKDTTNLTDGFEFRKGKDGGFMEHVSNERKFINDLEGLLRVLKGNLNQTITEFIEAGLPSPKELIIQSLTHYVTELMEGRTT